VVESLNDAKFWTLEIGNKAPKIAVEGTQKSEPPNQSSGNTKHCSCCCLETMKEGRKPKSMLFNCYCSNKLRVERGKTKTYAR